MNAFPECLRYLSGVSGLYSIRSIGIRHGVLARGAGDRKARTLVVSGSARGPPSIPFAPFSSYFLTMRLHLVDGEHLWRCHCHGSNVEASLGSFISWCISSASYGHVVRPPGRPGGLVSTRLSSLLATCGLRSTDARDVSGGSPLWCAEKSGQSHGSFCSRPWQPS